MPMVRINIQNYTTKYAWVQAELKVNQKKKEKKRDQPNRQKVNNIARTINRAESVRSTLIFLDFGEVSVV